MRGNSIATGESLARVRKEAGFETQQSLADALGIGRVTVARYESGAEVIDTKTALAIVAVLAHGSARGAAKAIEEIWQDLTGQPWAA